MPNPQLVAQFKQRIDRQEFKRKVQLTLPMTQAGADDDDKREIVAYFELKQPAVVQPVGPVFSAVISAMDFQQLAESPFDENKETYAHYGPQYWFNYFWAEVRKEKLSPMDRGLGLQAVTALFDKEADPSLPRGFRLRLKPALVPQEGPPASANAAATFTIAGDGAAIWQAALTQLLRIGFKAVPVGEPSMLKPVQNAMLEKQFVNEIKKDSGVRIFWRADSRGKEAFSEGAKRSVEDAAACARYGLDQKWHPFENDEIKSFMWFRRGQADNDFYTVVSVTTEVKTAVTFPLIDERRAYQMPLKPLEQWTEQELLTHRKHVAEVRLDTGAKRLLIATRTNVFMLAINGGVVMETRSAGAYYRGEDKGFPEAGVTGYPFEAFMGHAPVLRVHHGHTNAEGFTVFHDPATGFPPLYEPIKRLIHRFGDVGVRRVLTEWIVTGRKALDGEAYAWSSYGATAPSVKLAVKEVLSSPPTEARLREFFRTKK